MTLKEKFRQELTGHLSDEKTEVDVNIATRIAEEFAIGFAEWITQQSEVKIIKKSGLDNSYMKMSSKELLEIYKEEKGL